MDRQLVAEFPTLWLASDGLKPSSWTQIAPTDTREIEKGVYLQEMKLDLSGYVQDSLTVGFRRSFEQRSGTDFLGWSTFDPTNDFVIEQVIVSSVPMNDTQLILATVTSPGFIPYGGGIDWGNFNREHIIHGHYQLMYPNSTIGSPAFTVKGTAALMSVTDEYYSSLEPTAADCLYCYRIIVTSQAGNEDAGLVNLTMPAMRVILDAFTVEEPDLEYMMRLKRSYELANQV